MLPTDSFVTAAFFTCAVILAAVGLYWRKLSTGQNRSELEKMSVEQELNRNLLDELHDTSKSADDQLAGLVSIRPSSIVRKNAFARKARRKSREQAPAHCWALEASDGDLSAARPDFDLVTEHEKGEAPLKRKNAFERRASRDQARRTPREQAPTYQASAPASTEADDLSVPSSYAPPPWGAVPVTPFSLDVIEDGVVLETLDVSSCSHYVLGRHPSSADLVVPHPSVSRDHAVIQHRDTGEILFFDLGSTHGSTVDEEAVPVKTYIALRVGAMIRLGQSSCQLCLMREATPLRKKAQKIAWMRSYDATSGRNGGSSLYGGSSPSDLRSEAAADASGQAAAREAALETDIQRIREDRYSDDQLLAT